MPFDDELPNAPGTEAGAAVVIDDEIDSSAFEGVGKLGDVLPKATYHCRLDSFKEQSNENGPNFSLQWKVQEEPNTGRVVFDTIPWVSVDTIKAAAAGDPAAKSTMAQRLVRANSLMQAAGFKPSGKFGFKSFLSTNPEVKLTLSIGEKKTDSGKTDGKGKKVYVGTGEQVNNVVKYLSLQAPA